MIFAVPEKNNSRETRRPAVPVVLYLVDKSGFGGVQTIAGDLIDFGIPAVCAHFLFLRNLNSRFGLDDIRGDNVHYLNSAQRFSTVSLLGMLKVIRDRQADILHLNGNKSIIFGVIAKLLDPGLIIIAHDHGGVFDYTWWYAALLKLIRHRVDLFIGVSERRRRFYLQRCGIRENRVSVVNNFASPRRVLPPVDESHRELLEFKAPIIGYLGGLSRIKGCDLLVSAAVILRDAGIDFRLLIAGDGPARPELEQQVAASRLERQVTFLGVIKEPWRVYREMDVMVIPSRSEEGPISLFEAWLAGVPVVASDAPVLNERIQDGINGSFFRSGDPADLAVVLQRVIEDASLRQRMAEGGKSMTGELTVERYAGQLSRIYLDLYNKTRLLEKI